MLPCWQKVVTAAIAKTFDLTCYSWKDFLLDVM
jgi:hypothetical protein